MLLATDEHPAYGKLSDYPHAIIQHRDHVYVRGNVHTNSIENFWSLLKRGTIGTFHNISAEYLPLYLAELTFRHNFRPRCPSDFTRVSELAHRRHLRYDRKV